MKTIGLKDIDILDVGNDLQLYGAIYSGKNRIMLIPLPDEDPGEVQHLQQVIGGKAIPDAAVLLMNADEMGLFLAQTDVLDVRGAGKAILRKSQRQIDQNTSWAVFRRDSYACRYCGRNDVPLTVDHVDLWEDGGASIEENLLTACRRCNKLRGRTAYSAWISSDEYRGLSKNLPVHVRQANKLMLHCIPGLVLKRQPRRSR